MPSRSVHTISLNNNDMITLASDTLLGLVDMDISGLKGERIICSEFESSSTISKRHGNSFPGLSILCYMTSYLFEI
jgi:hypothetical protein